jgi:hypothetical protein
MHICRTTRTKESTGFRSVERGLQDNCLDAFGVTFLRIVLLIGLIGSIWIEFLRVLVIAQNKIRPILLSIRNVKRKLVVALTYDISAFIVLCERLTKTFQAKENVKVSRI